MKKFIVAALLVVSGCGYTQRDSEMLGQVKKVVNRTPIICPDRREVDISLGVLRNGVGSMSTQDVWLQVEDSDLYKKLKDANASGELVKIEYDTRRFVWCGEEMIVRKVEIVK